MKKTAILTIAYNSEKYLEKCITSVLNQTYGNFTYYLCDNGSNDGTRALIDKFAKTDSRISPVYIEVNSLTSTFNLMLKTIYDSDCEYLSVLDSDDWFEPDFLKETVINMNNHTDICVVSSNFIKESTMEIIHRRAVNRVFVMKYHQIPDYLTCWHQFFRTAWGKLYRLDLLRSKTILIGKYEYGSDTVFATECLKNSKKIVFTNKILHNYLIRNTSDSYIYRADRLKSDIYLYEYLLAILSKFGPISKLNQAFLYVVLSNAIKDSLENLILSDLNIEEKSQKIFEIFENKHVRESWSFWDSADDRTYEELSLVYNERYLVSFFEHMMIWTIKCLDLAVGIKSYSASLNLAHIMSDISALLNDEENFIQSNIYKYLIAKEAKDEAKTTEYKNFLYELGIVIDTK